MGRRAIRKKMAKQFKVGDVVTWGQRIWAHRVVALGVDGVYVDATSSGFGPRFFVRYFHRQRGAWADLEVTDMKPDVKRK